MLNKVFQILLSVQILVEKETIHALVDIFFWSKQTKPKIAKLNMRKSKNTIIIVIIIIDIIIIIIIISY